MDGLRRMEGAPGRFDSESSVLDFKSILLNLDYQAQEKTSDTHQTWKARTEFVYQGIQVELQATLVVYPHLEHQSFQFELRHQGRAFLYSSLTVGTEDQMVQGVPEKRLISHTSINRIGRKANVPKELAGIGLAFYANVLDYQQKIANDEKQVVYDWVQPSPRDSGDWGLKDQVEWDKKFQPLLFEKGYTKRQVATVADPARGLRRATMYAEEVVPGMIASVVTVYERKYEPTVSE